MAKKFKYIGSTPVSKYSLPSFSTVNNSFSTIIVNGGLELTKKFSIAQTTNREKQLVITQKNVTLTDLKIYNINELNDFIKIFNNLKLNIDRTNLSSYAAYGSLKEKFRVTVNNIINKFPGGLHINDFVSGVTYFNVLDYNYDELNDTSSFRTPITVLENPFYLNLFSNSLLNSRNLSNLPVRYEDYVLAFSGINYGINGFTGFSSTNSSYLYFSINGNPFESFSSTSISDRFIIKPNDIEFNKFHDSLSDLERYFLNKNSSPQYTFEFKIPEVNEDDELEFITYSLTFPVKYDGYNLDTESITYIDFLDKIFEIGDLYDEYKSNLIIRKFTPNSLIDFDSTDGFKSESILKIYGKEIDEIKIFFDSLMSINNTSYDKVNNIPDALIKNLARTLSWKAQNIINDKDLLNSIFANDRSKDTDVTASLAEVDIELWRRLVINTGFFLKSKGTRSAIETIFSFIGAPESLIGIDEHVYVVEAPIGKSFSITESDMASGLISRPPYDADGYPASPTPNALEYFQISGNNDSGQAYINLFRNEGFKVLKTLDNKKSWVYEESAVTHSSFDRNTYYEADDSRLIINTKEIDLNIDASRAIEYDVYQFNVENNFPVSYSGGPIPYPQRESNNFQASGLTFAQYIDKVYSNFINVQNRKVSDSAVGSYYPSLTKLYYDYLDNPLSNKRRYRELLDYIDNIDAIFDVFVKQFIPATAIFNEGSVRIRNTEFTPQKFVYKQGIDDGSEFQSQIKTPPEVKQNIILIESEFFDTIEDSIQVATISTEVTLANDRNSNYIIGYTNINMQPNWDGVICENEKPNFTLTGATKIELSSLTNNSLFNKSIQTGKTLTFNFTSATNTITATTTEFYYSLHKYDNSVNANIFDSTPIYIFSATGITSTTLTDIISGDVLSCDSEYIIKPYFIFKTCEQSGTTFSADSPYNMHDLFLLSGYTTQSYRPIEKIGWNENYISYGPTKLYRNSTRYFDYNYFVLNTGSSITTLVDITQYTPKFGSYNYLDDYYFVSICDAETPLFNFPTGNENQGLIVESVTVDSTNFIRFGLEFEPIGDIIVAVNGVTIQRGLEYDIDTSIPLPSMQKRSFILYQRLTTAHNDIVTVSYYKNPSNNQKLVKENFEYSGSPNITFNGNNYEIALSYSRIGNSDIIVYWNGILLSKDADYFVSVYNQNTIVLDSSLNLLDGDAFSVVYFTSSVSSQVINVSGPSYVVNWSVSNFISSNINGKFIHQFYDIADTGLTSSTVYSLETPYLYNTYTFSQGFNWLDTTLTAGTTYFYRISSEKYFTTINNINLSSTSYSETIKIKLPV